MTTTEFEQTEAKNAEKGDVIDLTFRPLIRKAIRTRLFLDQLLQFLSIKSERSAHFQQVSAHGSDRQIFLASFGRSSAPNGQSLVVVFANLMIL